MRPTPKNVKLIISRFWQFFDTQIQKSELFISNEEVEVSGYAFEGKNKTNMHSAQQSTILQLDFLK